MQPSWTKKTDLLYFLGLFFFSCIETFSSIRYTCFILKAINLVLQSSSAKKDRPIIIYKSILLSWTSIALELCSIFHQQNYILVSLKRQQMQLSSFKKNRPIVIYITRITWSLLGTVQRTPVQMRDNFAMEQQRTRAQMTVTKRWARKMRWLLVWLSW